MDEQTQKIEAHIKNLPKDVQDFLAGNEWENRVNEISKKYGLDQKQTEALSNNTMLLLVGLSDPEKLTTNIEEDLGISGLLSEQIFEDLEKRVFDYAIKALEKDTSKSQTPQTITSKIPEIRPENLPADVKVEQPARIENKIEVPRYSPTEKPSLGISYKPTSQNVNVGVNTSAPKIVYSPVNQEPVQKPAFVPRLDMSSEQTTAPSNVPTPINNIIDTKLNNVTPGVKDTPQEQRTETPLVKQYTVDPYREPME